MTVTTCDNKEIIERTLQPLPSGPCRSFAQVINW